MTAYTGPATVLPVPAAASPGMFYVDVLLTTPFVYDPNLGDLMVELDHDGTNSGGTSANTDLVSTGTPLGSRVWHSSSQTAPTSLSVQPNIVVAMEINFLTGAGTASVARIGTGCPAAAPLSLTASPRPILGTSVTLTTSNIPAGTNFGATILSLARLNPPMDLALLQMPGCTQYTGLDLSLLFLVTGSTGLTPIAIPLGPSYSGMHLYSQSVTFSAGFTPLGVIASNAMDLQLGTQ